MTLGDKLCHSGYSEESASDLYKLLIKCFFPHAAVLPRLAAADGLLLLAWSKSNKRSRPGSFLVKTYENLNSGSIYALAITPLHRSHLILPWSVLTWKVVQSFSCFFLRKPPMPNSRMHWIMLPTSLAKR